MVQTLLGTTWQEFSVDARRLMARVQKGAKIYIEARSCSTCSLSIKTRVKAVTIPGSVEGRRSLRCCQLSKVQRLCIMKMSLCTIHVLVRPKASEGILSIV